MATPKIPPNGFIGTGSQTAAVQQMINRAMGPKRRTTKKRRKKVARKRPTRRRASTRARSTKTGSRSARGRKKPAHMVKGSAAAKRHMAKLRKMRRKR